MDEKQPASSPATHFIRKIIDADLESGKHEKVFTRFPPEPNGYLHIGHAKSIFLNFGMARDFGGHCFMRFDDTNPVKEDATYAEAILEDIRWLGFNWGERLTHATNVGDQDDGSLHKFLQMMPESDARRDSWRVKLLLKILSIAERRNFSSQCRF